MTVTRFPTVLRSASSASCESNCFDRLHQTNKSHLRFEQADDIVHWTKRETTRSTENMERNTLSEGSSRCAGGATVELHQLGGGTKNSFKISLEGTPKTIESKYSERQRAIRMQATRRYRAKNAELVRESSKNYKRKLRLTPIGIEHERAIQTAWRNRNRNHLRKYSADRYAKNSKKITSKRKLLRKINPVERIKANCRARVSFILKKSGIPRFNRTFELIGCTPDFFKSHIENQFRPGMTWDNYGDWEIDHIKPLATYDLLNREQLLNAFSYLNCQPLWKIENRMKNCRWSLADAVTDANKSPIGPPAAEASCKLSSRDKPLASGASQH